MMLIGIFAFIVIAAISGFYYQHFGHVPVEFSKEQEVWGQFGDYFGGTLNPILSFISIILLIRSVTLQVAANKSIIDENKRQEKLDLQKGFEAKFYNMIEAQKSAFDDFHIILSTPKGNKKHDGAEAVSKVEDLIKICLSHGVTGTAISQVLQNLDDNSGDKIYSFIRRYYLLVKVVDIESKKSNEFNFEKQKEYFEILVNYSDFAAVRLLCISLYYYEWENVKFINSSAAFKHVLDNSGMVEYMADLK